MTVLATLLVVIILFLRNSRRCKGSEKKEPELGEASKENKYQQQPSSQSKQKKQKNKKPKKDGAGGENRSKWSIMLDKRPLPKLPPETRLQQHQQQQGIGNKTDTGFEEFNTSPSTTNHRTLERNKTLLVEQLDSSPHRKSYTITTPNILHTTQTSTSTASERNVDPVEAQELSGNNLNKTQEQTRGQTVTSGASEIHEQQEPAVNIDHANMKSRAASTSDSSTYAQYNYGNMADVAVADGHFETSHGDSHYVENIEQHYGNMNYEQSNAYAYARYGPDYAYADASYATGDQGYESVTPKNDVYEGCVSSSWNKDCVDSGGKATGSEDLYQALNNHYEVEYDEYKHYER